MLDGIHHTHIRTMTGYSTASELANEKGSIAGWRAMVGGGLCDELLTG